MTKVGFAVGQVQNVQLVKMKGQFSVKFSRNVCCHCSRQWTFV